MDISKISAGKNVPEEMNVIVEIPAGESPVKYEMDKDTGALLVDRVMHTPMRYPCNYGFIPHTLSGDGDPVDVLLLSPVPFVAGCVAKARPIGVLLMEDQAGEDEKVLMVPTNDIYPFYEDVTSYEQLPKIQLQQIEHFFQHYKDLEDGKWVKIEGWADADEARKKITEGIARVSG